MIDNARGLPFPVQFRSLFFDPHHTAKYLTSSRTAGQTIHGYAFDRGPTIRPPASAIALFDPDSAFLIIPPPPTMAHPLTQQPPSALPFTSASRPSLLGFGFGYPTSAASFGLHAGQFGGNGIPSLGEGSSSGTPFSSTKRFSPTSKAAVSSDQPAQRSLKRTRLSRSPSPSSSPRSTSSVSSSPRLKSRDLWKGSEKEDLTVGALAINNPSRRTNGSRKEVKRLRRDDLTENGVSERSAGEVDVGVLLGKHLDVPSP